MKIQLSNAFPKQIIADGKLWSLFMVLMSGFKFHIIKLGSTYLLIKKKLVFETSVFISIRNEMTTSIFNSTISFCSGYFWSGTRIFGTTKIIGLRMNMKLKADHRIPNFAILSHFCKCKVLFDYVRNTMQKRKCYQKHILLCKFWGCLIFILTFFEAYIAELVVRSFTCPWYSNLLENPFPN